MVERIGGNPRRTSDGEQESRQRKQTPPPAQRQEPRPVREPDAHTDQDHGGAETEHGDHAHVAADYVNVHAPDAHDTHEHHGDAAPHAPAETRGPHDNRDHPAEGHVHVQETPHAVPAEISHTPTVSDHRPSLLSDVAAYSKETIKAAGGAVKSMGAASMLSIFGIAIASFNFISWIGGAAAKKAWEFILASIGKNFDGYKEYFKKLSGGSGGGHADHGKEKKKDDRGHGGGGHGGGGGHH